MPAQLLPLPVRARQRRAALLLTDMRESPVLFQFEDRLSDSPLVERVWTARSERAGPFLSIASGNSEIVVSRLHGRTFITVRGPETEATSLDCPVDGDWLGIRFKAGAFLPAFLPGTVRDRRDVTLPEATDRSFWLAGSAWEYPSFENADTFVVRLVREGILVRDRVVDAVLRREPDALSRRSAQRHFVRATGLTHATYRKIAQEIRKLKQEPGKSLLQYGIGELTHTMLEHGLVDEIRLLVFPFAFGEGPRIFERMGVHPLKLLATKTFDSGVVELRYRCSCVTS
jgi:hypothetical protein